MVREDLKMSNILGRASFENAIKVNAAIGGSTNCVVHLLALAGRVGVELSLDDFDRLGSELPLLVNLMPAGKYLMEDFYYAGGLPVVIQELRDSLAYRRFDGDGQVARRKYCRGGLLQSRRDCAAKPRR